MTGDKLLTHIEVIRDALGKLNRIKLSLTTTEVENIYSPPYQGFKTKTREYQYPPQLVGYRSNRNKERVRITGSTNGDSQFGGISGSAYGMASGSTYNT